MVKIEKKQWHNKDSYTMYQMHIQDVDIDTLASVFHKSKRAIISKIHDLNIIYKKMKAYGINDQILCDTVLKYNGDYDKIAASLNLNKKEVRSFLSLCPYADNAMGRFNLSRQILAIKRTSNNIKKIQMNPHEVYNGFSKLEIAVRKFGNRVRYHKNLGYILDGNPISVILLINQGNFLE